MPRDAGVPPEGVANTVDGGVSGTVLQASMITGGVHIHQPRAVGPAAALPFRVGVVPPRAASFQERAAGDQVACVLDGGDAAVLISDSAGQATVLSGLGGVGKTQLAADYAERVWGAAEVELLVWVTAGSREAIVSAYARVAAMLTGVEDPDPERAARSLLEWLAGTAASWLVVLDDVQAPGDLAGLWPPVTDQGRVVVTTRRRDTALRGHRRRLVEVGVFTEAEAQAYLAAALAARQRLLDGAAGLVKDLGCLPLALAQAAAYMLDRQLSCAAYRVRLAGRRLVSVVPEPGGLPDEHRATVAATWSLSVRQADLLVPEGVARPLLEVASVLDANGIPLEVFTAPTVLELLTATAGRVIDEHDARDGLGCLYRLSLIDLNLDSPSRAVRIHALVQRATRDSLPDKRTPVVVRAAADAVLQVWPDIERDTVLTQILRANTDALDTAGGQHLWRPDCHEVFFRSGNSLGESGLVAEARDYFDKLRAIAAQCLGPDHADELTARHNLADWRGEAGDAAGAAAAFDELLAARLRILGPDHTGTLNTRHNLAYWRGEAGDPAGAAAALEGLLADRLRLLGPDHPDTLSTRHNLARWWGETGDPAGAAAAFEELLADCSRVFGPDHPDTLTTRHNLARWRGEAGDAAGAAAAFDELLADRLRILGPDHPGTLSTRHNLAHWRGETGDPAGAAAAFEELLADRLRILGPDHPGTLSTRSNFARSRGAAGDPAGATAALEELLADCSRVLGPDHPDTLITRHNLAYWRGEAGDPAGATAAFKELLADQLRILEPPDHPDILATRHNLEHWERVSSCRSD